MIKTLFLIAIMVLYCVMDKTFEENLTRERKKKENREEKK